MAVRGASVAVVSGGLWLGHVGSPPWRPLVAGGALELRLSTGRWLGRPGAQGVSLD